MNGYFNHIYVITRENFCDRHKYIKSHFSKFNLSYEFVFSTDSRLYQNSGLTTASEKSLISGHLYCLYHAKIHEFDKILICEDDVKFVDNVFEEFRCFIEKVPLDWKYLQLGNQFWAEKWVSRTELKENLYTFEWGTGSHCIGINSSTFDDTIEKFKSYSLPVDRLYYDLFKQYRCYCPKNFLADAVSKSDHLNFKDVGHIFNSTINHTEF